jgi:hypothetical protein
MDIRDFYIKDYPFHLYVFTDMHLGSPVCDEKEIASVVTKFSQDKEAKAWCDLGDKIAAIKSSDIRRYEGVFPEWVEPYRMINSQIDRYINSMPEIIINPPLFMLRGNHEEMYRKSTNFDPHFSITEQFMLDPTNSASILFDLNLQWSGKTRSIIKCYAHHGFVTSKYADTRNNIINRYIKSSATIDANLFLFGHCHKLAVDSSVIYLSKKRSKYIAGRKTFVLCGGFEKTFGDDFSPYTEQWGCAPTDLGAVRVVINPTEYHVELLTGGK